jgi:hypothetical protein
VKSTAHLRIFAASPQALVNPRVATVDPDRFSSSLLPRGKRSSLESFGIHERAGAGDKSGCEG